MANRPSRAKTAPSALPAGLVEELGRLKEALGRTGHGPGLMVVRFFEQASLEQWKELALPADQALWQALELEGEPYPRLRELLARLVDHREGEYGRLLSWEGLKRGLAAELERARLETTPLSLAFVEIHGSAGKAAQPKTQIIQAMTHLFLSRQRPFDRVAICSGGRFAMLWPGLGPMRSVAYLTQFASEGASLLRSQDEGAALAVSAGAVATRGGNLLDLDDFADLALKALEKAKQRGGGRVEQAASPDAPIHSARTLVGGDEKRFLFGR